MPSYFSLNTVIYDTANKNKTNAKPRFELSTVQSPPRFATCTLKKRAVRAQGFFATCHDEAGAIML